MQDPPGNARSCWERWDSPALHGHGTDPRPALPPAPPGPCGDSGDTARAAPASGKSLREFPRGREGFNSSHREMFDRIPLENPAGNSILWCLCPPKHPAAPREDLGANPAPATAPGEDFGANPAKSSKCSIQEAGGSLIPAPHRAKRAAGRECGASRPKFAMSPPGWGWDSGTASQAPSPSLPSREPQHPRCPNFPTFVHKNNLA